MGLHINIIEQIARIFDQFFLIFVNGSERMISERENRVYKDTGEGHNGMREIERDNGREREWR